MMILLLLLIGSLIFGGICYMSAKTWRVSHVVLLFFVFLMTFLFTVLSAASLKTHQTWKKNYQDLASQLEAQERQLEVLEHGDVLAPEDDSENLPTIRNEYARLVVDRGRVWRNVKPAGGELLPMNVLQVDLNMGGWGDSQCIQVGDEDDGRPIDPVPEEGAPPAAPTVDHSIAVGMVLFGFLELGVKPADLFRDYEPGEAAPGVCRVPGFYSGSYRVESVDGNNLRLLSVLPVDEEQKGNIQQGQATWTLYEVMPVDSHEAMAGMQPEEIRVLFGNQPEIAEEYVRDLAVAVPGDPDNRTMRKIKFLRDYEVSVDVEGEEPGIDRNFSPDGRAILANLRQGEPTQFKSGTVPDVLFPTEVANRWRRDGICEFVDEQPVYVRPLHDYRYHFYQKNRQIEGLRDLMAVLKRENASIAATEAKARDQLAYREQELSHLQQDRSKTSEELQLLTGHLAELERKRQEQRSGLGSLYQWNNQQADELRGAKFYGASSR